MICASLSFNACLRWHVMSDYSHLKLLITCFDLLIWLSIWCFTQLSYGIKSTPLKRTKNENKQEYKFKRQWANQWTECPAFTRGNVFGRTAFSRNSYPPRNNLKQHHSKCIYVQLRWNFSIKCIPGKQSNYYQTTESGYHLRFTNLSMKNLSCSNCSIFAQSMVCCENPTAVITSPTGVRLTQVTYSQMCQQPQYQLHCLWALPVQSLQPVATSTLKHNYCVDCVR